MRKKFKSGWRPDDATIKAIEWVERYYHPIRKSRDTTFYNSGEQWQYDLIIEPFFKPEIESVYIEMGRDWDKTGLCAACAFASGIYKRSHQMKIFGGDKDQAGNTMKAIVERITSHRTFKEVRNVDKEVKIKRNMITYKNGSELSIEAADGDWSFGKPCDLAILDELHCWNKSQHAILLESLLTKKGTKTIVTTNAGSKKEGLCWQLREKWRKAAKTDKAFFYFSGESSPLLPSWITEEYIKKQMLRLHVESAIKRLYYCQWGMGGDVFSEKQLERCIDKDLKYDNVINTGSAMSAFDYGRVNDFAAGATLDWYKNTANSLRIVNYRVWRGSHSNPVSTDVAYDYAIDAIENMASRKHILEAWNMATVYERLSEKYGDMIELYTPTEKSVIEMSSTLIDLIANGRLRFPEDESLVNEMLNIEAVFPSNKDKECIKLVYPRGKSRGYEDEESHGHGDRARAINIAAHYLILEGRSKTLSEMIGDIRGIRDTGDYNRDSGDLATMPEENDTQNMDRELEY